MSSREVHFGLAGEIPRRRVAVLAQAYTAHHKRFIRGLPQPAEVPKEVWINKPAKSAENRPTEIYREVKMSALGQMGKPFSVCHWERPGNSLNS